MIEKTLIDEIRQSGFLLELQAAEVFYTNGYTVEPNILLDTAVPREGAATKLVEIDILATVFPIGRTGEACVVECKGAASADRLVLIPTSKRCNSIPTVIFHGGEIIVDGDNNIFCDNSSPSGHPICCHTGDFFAFNKSKNNFSKASKQDEKNNLYHGISQLYFGLDAVFTKLKEHTLRLFPIIVTNAEIQVVNFNLEAPVDQQISTTTVPWIAYKNPMAYRHNTSHMGMTPWKSSQDAETKVYASQNRIPAIWIVNLANLQAFLTSPGKIYSQK